MSEETVTTFDVASQQLQETPVPPASGRETSEQEGYAPAQKPPAESGTQGDTSFDDGGNQEPQRGKNWVPKKIDELTREREDARREAAELRELLKRSLQPREQPQQPQQRPQVPQEYANDPGYDPNDPEPNRADFDDYDVYARKLSRWEARMEVRGAQKRQAFEQHRERVMGEVVRETREIAQHYDRSAQAWEKEHPDYDEKVGTLASIDAEAHPMMTRAIFTSHNPPALLDALAGNPEVAHRITQLRPEQQIKAIAFIEARLQNQVAQVSNAPRVGRPVGSSAVGTRQAYRDDFTPAQHRAWKKAQGIE